MIGEYLTELNFPMPSREEVNYDAVRMPILKANSYVTFALDNENIPHKQSRIVSGVIDSTYNLKIREDPDEYLDLAQQELALAMSNTEDDWLEKELGYVYETISMARDD